VGLLEEFTKVCDGFVDTLQVFKEKIPKRKSYSQTSLAADHDIPNMNAHNAAGDVAVLEALVQKVGVSWSELLRFVKSFPSIIL